jgi:integrase
MKVAYSTRKFRNAKTPGCRWCAAIKEEMAMAAPRTRSPQPRQMDAGVLGAEIGSFRLHLAAEGKAPKTIGLYTEAVAWFAAARLLGQAGKTGWQQAGRRDVQEWMAWLLGRYSDAYASNQYRALQQFFKWLSAEEDLPDPMAGLHPPKVAGKLVPVFTAADGAGSRGPLTASGIYQAIARRGRRCGVQVWPHRFRHHFSHTWLERGGPEGDLMELNGWASPQMLARYGASARSARARRTYDRIMTGTP